MFPQDFKYHAPDSVDEVIRLLTSDSSARLLGGGMSLLPLVNLDVLSPGALVSLSRVPDLDGVSISQGSVHVGGSTTHAQLAADSTARTSCPLLADAAAAIADVQVRNRGTLGGSLAHGYPGAEYATVLAALDATIHTQGAAGHRSITARTLVTGRLQTAIARDEIITRVGVPLPESGTRAAYLRFSRVQGNYSTVNVAAIVSPDDRVTLSIGGALERPVVIETDLDADIERLAEQACADSYDDHMASAAYRTAMAGVLSRRVLNAALADAPFGR